MGRPVRQAAPAATHPREDSMDYKTLWIDRKPHACILYLNRPDVLNALSNEMREELMHFLQQAGEDKEVRVLIVTGKGRAFSAGADLNVFKQRFESYREQGQMDGAFRKLLPKAITSFPKPIIAAINGPAVGFGATMPLICDIRIASTQATFSFAFLRLGVTPEFCSSYTLPRLIGHGKAAELIYTARTIDAQEALQIGLVNHVVAPEALLPKAEEMAKEISRMPPDAVQWVKGLLRGAGDTGMDQVLEYETVLLQQAMQTQAHYDAVCGLLARMEEKRNRPAGKS
jgi:2-(1,2-epoxy-1,2-dihydrophenyl)acetyl-CoA isomerase